MKLVREHINEVFSEKSDPITDLGIGLFSKHDFNDIEEATSFVVTFMPAILRLNEIPDDILNDQTYYIKREYDPLIDKYINDYIRIKGKNPGVVHYNVDWDNNIYQHIHDLLCKKGYNEI